MSVGTFSERRDTMLKSSVKHISILAALFLCTHPLACRGKRSKRPGLLQPSHLVVEMPWLKACEEAPGNSIEFSKFETRMVSRVNFGMDAAYNITRSVSRIELVLVRLTKCREIVSANTCEVFQTWRFDKDPCQAFQDKNSPWRYALDGIQPSPECPVKKAAYRMNLNMSSAALAVVPLPWEGNVWLTRFSMMESGTRHHICIDEEMRIHRVRG